MREIKASEITAAVAKLCVKSNVFLNSGIREALEKSLYAERSAPGRNILSALIENADIAAGENMPICQDTGMVVVFAALGQDAHIIGGWIEEAIQEGVRIGYRDGYLRNSVVRDPIDRVNTGDNTPAVVHYRITPGDKLTLTVAPKGFGSENMSRVKMLTPADGYAGVKEFVLECVRCAGANPCPPIIAGVGVGGTMEKAAILAKQALLRPIGASHISPFWAQAEAEMLCAINETNIGPAGLGGATTALAVHIETFPTHIAGLPVAVNIGCHVTRHAETTL